MEQVYKSTRMALTYALNALEMMELKSPSANWVAWDSNRTEGKWDETETYLSHILNVQHFFSFEETGKPARAITVTVTFNTTLDITDPARRVTTHKFQKMVMTDTRSPNQRNFILDPNASDPYAVIEQ